MSKLDSWMPFYGDDFNSATRMFPREVKWSYLDALWFYWAHTKCTGLPDDDDMLRRLCGCEKTEWVRTKGVIFASPFFEKDAAGLWQQKRAKAEYEHAAKVYEARSKSGSKGGSKTASKHKTEDQQKGTHLTTTITSDKEDDKASRPKKLPIHQSELATRLEAALGEQWVNDAGKWIERVKKNFSKAERVCAELEDAIRENRIETTRAQYAEQMWKEFE